MSSGKLKKFESGMTRGGGFFLTLPEGLIIGLLLVDELDDRGVLFAGGETESSSHDMLT